MNIKNDTVLIETGLVPFQTPQGQDWVIQAREIVDMLSERNAGGLTGNTSVTFRAQETGDTTGFLVVTGTVSENARRWAEALRSC